MVAQAPHPLSPAQRAHEYWRRREWLVPEPAGDEVGYGWSGGDAGCSARARIATMNFTLLRNSRSEIPEPWSLTITEEANKPSTGLAEDQQALDDKYAFHVPDRCPCGKGCGQR